MSTATDVFALIIIGCITLVVSLIVFVPIGVVLYRTLTRRRV